MLRQKLTRNVALLVLFTLTAFPATAGLIGSSRADTLDRVHNTATLETYILEQANWVSRVESEQIVAFFNKIAKQHLKLDQDTPLVYFVMKYRGDPIGAVVYREGGLLTVDMNYRPLPMDQASLNQLLDCDILTDQKRVQLVFRSAEDQHLLRQDTHNHMVMVPDEIKRRLGASGSPFEEIIQIK